MSDEDLLDLDPGEDDPVTDDPEDDDPVIESDLEPEEGGA
jgi:hypothetical protein